ncbi:hypothetical protein NFI96_019494, partial [Prochilodus magdalenae]
MRTLFSIVLSALLAVACWAETAPARDNKQDMLETAIKQLTHLKLGKNTDALFYSPTNTIEKCCSRSALECFNSQLLSVSTANKDLQNKLHKTLRKNSTVSSVDRCTMEEKAKVQCQPCNSYPMINSQEFLKNLLGLLQK